MLKRLLFAVLMLLAFAAQATVYSLPWGPKPQFVDANGAPMSGGSLLTFVAGSTTARVTYTDSTGGTANPTTITLNTRGETPNEVWLASGVSYKLVLKDSAGATIWTVDGVSGVNDVSASVREWISGPAPTFVSATSFTLAGDQTTTFTAGRRVKTTNSGGTIYSIITSAVFGAATTVTVVNDSGVIDSGLSAVSYGILAADNSSVPHTKFSTTQFGVQDAFALAGVITPAQITATQNDYSPTGLSQATTLRINSDAARTITGLAGGIEGRIVVIHNTGSFGITLSRQDAGSTTTNRFAIDANMVIATDQTATLRYDATTGRWRSAQYSDGQYRSVQVFTGTGTYTAPTGLKRVKVRIYGATGGGGGSAAGRDAGGGAGGGYAEKTISAATVGASQTVTIGAKGTGGAAGANNGTGGGTTSFGAIMSASGGSGGIQSGTTAAGGVTPGGGTGGDINITGQQGQNGLTTAALAIAGGGMTPGGGSGGGGGSNGGAGSDGVDGLVVVEEFF